MSTESKHEQKVRGLEAEDVIRLEALRSQGHPQCLACMHPELRLDFRLESPHVLVSEVDFTDEMTSFNHKVHGGLQSFLIDQAMTCALMGVGVYGATCELKLRYKKSVEVALPAQIRVWVEKRYRKIYDLKAELLQGGKIRTLASARFLEQPLVAS